MSETRIVLLRGINVGGHRKVPMVELRAGLTAAGFADVRTYIQSGNVVVVGGPDDDAAVGAMVESLLLDRFGLDDVPVVVRSTESLEHARSTSQALFPAHDDDDEHGRRVHVVFLVDRPAPTRRASLDPDGFGDDRFHLDIHRGSADLHVRYANGAAGSKLTVERIERAYGVRATARNLNTVERLVAMSAG
jgi:uncharacterized protein (DUF1697 family)